MENPDTKFDENIFYCVAEDDTQHVVVAKNEDEIPNAKLVISLAEVERIRLTLLNAKAVLKATPPLEESVPTKPAT